jgi:hypothetical protein
VVQAAANTVQIYFHTVYCNPVKNGMRKVTANRTSHFDDLREEKSLAWPVYYQRFLIAFGMTVKQKPFALSKHEGFRLDRRCSRQVAFMGVAKAPQNECKK